MKQIGLSPPTRLQQLTRVGVCARELWYLCKAKDFMYKLDKSEQNLCENKRLSSKICQTSPPNFVKGLSKSWLIFCPFYMDESERNEGKGWFMLKKPFFYQLSQLKKYLMKFCWQLISSEFNKIFLSFLFLYEILCYRTKINKMKWNFTTLNEVSFTLWNNAFIQFCSIL